MPLRDFGDANARFGSKADIGVHPRNVRFTSESGHCLECCMVHRLLVWWIASNKETPVRPCNHYGTGIVWGAKGKAAGNPMADGFAVHDASRAKLMGELCHGKACFEE